MLERLILVWQRRDLIATLVQRDLRTRYKGSVLGILWSLMHPIVLAGVYTVAFQFVIRVPIENYTVFLLSGLLPWIFFSTALSTSADSIVNQAQLVKKVAFPREVLPLATVLAQLVNFAIAYFIVVPLLAAGQVGVGPGYVFLPVLILLLVLFTCGLAMAVATLQVYLRDTRHLLTVALQIWFWATPIVYSLDLIPERFRWIALANPLTLFVTSFHRIIVGVALPDLTRFALLIVLTAAVFVAGYAIFLRGNGRMAEYV